MGETMKLADVINQLEMLDDEMTIYAREPWTPDSEATVEVEPDVGGLPNQAKDQGLAYFLEVFVAQEFVEGWLGNMSEQPTDLDVCKRLIEYAINDA